MYGKLFASMYEGTLYGQWQAIVTLQQLVILADEDGIVDMTPPAISARTSVPLDIIEIGIDALSAADKYSRSPDDEGRRIVLIDESRPWGWRIVNYLYYRNLGSRVDKKIKDKKRIAEKRSKINNKKECRDVSQVVADCSELSHEVADVAHTNRNTDKEIYTALKNAEPEKTYQTKKGRKLTGECLESFERFWIDFDYKKGKSEAADEWFKISLKNGTLEKILESARREALNRPNLIAKGLTPKMAQGWLSGRRWEDEQVDAQVITQPKFSVVPEGWSSGYDNAN